MRAIVAACRANQSQRFEGNVTLSFEDPQRMFTVLSETRRRLMSEVTPHLIGQPPSAFWPAGTHPAAWCTWAASPLPRPANCGSSGPCHTRWWWTPRPSCLKKAPLRQAGTTVRPSGVPRIKTARFSIQPACRLRAACRRPCTYATCGPASRPSAPSFGQWPPCSRCGPHCWQANQPPTGC